MAHFEDDTHHRILGEILPIRVGHRRTIFLWGGNFDGSPLSVTTSHPGVLQITEEEVPRGTPPHYRKFIVRATTDADTVQVFASPSSNGGNPWDTVNFIVLTAAESGEYYRNRIMSTAAANLGAHYLWGAAGAAPDALNGMPGRPGSVHLLSNPIDRGDIVNSVAVCRVAGNNTCAGKPWLPGQNTPAYILNSSGVNLQNETAALSYRTVHTTYRRVRKPGIILGERCEGKRHFDCVGFVNYCLSTSLGSPTQMDICGGAASSYRGYANSLPKLGEREPHLPGDILIFGGSEIEFEGRTVLSGAHHIGFSAGDGANMIHASETEFGVVRTGIGRDLTRRLRHPRLS